MTRRTRMDREPSIEGIDVRRGLPHELDAVFIADLHLGADIGPTHLGFRDLLVALSTAPRRPRLYILGDLFDYWIGPRSECAEGHRFALLCIRRAVEEGLGVWFQEGNRDFLLDRATCERYGMRKLAPTESLSLGDRRVVVTHGDGLTVRDRWHQRFRWLVRSFWVRYLARVMPARLVEGVAGTLRRSSRGNRPRASTELFDIPAEASARLLRGGHDTVICGHIHRISRREVQADDRTGHLITLGDWGREASFLGFGSGRFVFVSFPLEPRPAPAESE